MDPKEMGISPESHAVGKKRRPNKRNFSAGKRFHTVLTTWLSTFHDETEAQTMMDTA